MGTAVTAPATLAKRVRRWVIGVIIVSFGIAALGGIFVLLSGEWTDTTGKVLATTALTGLFSVAVLCGAALLGKPGQWFAWVTIAIAVTTLVILLVQLWAEADWGETTFKFDVTASVVTAACAVASLLLLLVTHSSNVVRALLFLTIALMAITVTLSLLPVWDYEIGEGDWYWRLTGSVAILTALGVIVLPVMSLLLRGRTLSAASLDRITAAASARGVTPDELVEQLLP